MVARSKASRMQTASKARSGPKQTPLDSWSGYEVMFEHTGTAMVITEEDGILSLVNAEFERLSGYTKGEIEGKKSWREFVVKDDLERMEEYHRLRRLDPRLAPRNYEFRFIDREGRIKDILLTIGMVPGTKRSVASLLDMTEHKRVEEALRASEETYRTLFEESRDAIYIATREGNLVDVNKAFLDLFGYPRDETMELQIEETYVNPIDRQRFQHEIEREGFVRDYEVELQKSDGTQMDCLLTATVRRANDGSILGYQGIIRDITERKRTEEHLAYMATHDALTGLANLMLFNDRLTLALAHAQRQQSILAVMLLDLDRFKDINDTKGHNVGDHLLQAVGDRLTGLLRKSDTVARMGGDEFLLLLPEISRVEHAGKAARKILNAIRKPFVLDDHSLRVTTSIGVAIYPEDGEDARTMVKNADIAMYQAKEQGRNKYRRYTPRLSTLEPRSNL